jgi:hypothetical protein
MPEKQPLTCTNFPAKSQKTRFLSYPLNAYRQSIISKMYASGRLAAAWPNITPNASPINVTLRLSLGLV